MNQKQPENLQQARQQARRRRRRKLMILRTAIVLAVVLLFLLVGALLVMKIVGTQQGSTGKAIVNEYAPKATVQELGTDEELRTALSQGRIDAYVVDSSLHMSSIISNPGKYRLAAEFGPEDPYGIGLPLDSDGVAFVNGFLKAIEDSGEWSDLWKICLGDRTGITEVPNPPAIEN